MRKKLSLTGVIATCFLIILVSCGKKPEVTSISATYSGDTEEGTVLDKDNSGIEVKEIYSDGSEKVVNDWDIKEAQELKAGKTATIEIQYGDFSTSLDVKCTTAILESVTASYTGSTKPETIININDFELKGNYSDGSSRKLEGCTLDKDYTLKAGKKTTVKIHYNDASFEVTVQADTPSKPEIDGKTLNCSADEYVEYLDYTTNDRVTIQKVNDVVGDDGNRSLVYNMYFDSDLECTFLIIEKDGKASSILLSMAEGNDDSLYAYALVFADRIVDSYCSDDDQRLELFQNRKYSQDGLTIMNSSGITTDKASCLIYITSDEKNENDDEETTGITEVEEIYNMATTLTKDKCTKNSLGQYGYNGITFTTEESEWLDSPINKKGQINASAFYVKLAKCLEGFSIGNSWDDYSPHILGYTPESREAFGELVDDLSSYIVYDHPAQALIKKFKTVSCIDIAGEDDEFDVTITSLSGCAEEMGISQEMLGYIIAAIHDCGGENITFNGDTCSFHLEFF